MLESSTPPDAAQPAASVNELQAALGDAGNPRRQVAAIADCASLLSTRPKEIVPLLERALQDKAASVRRAAVEALATTPNGFRVLFNVGYSDITPKAIASKEARAAFLRGGGQAAAAVAPALYMVANLNFRRRVLRAMVEIGEASVPALLNVLQKRKPNDGRYLAAEGLGALKATIAMPALREVLSRLPRYGEERLRKSAERALAKFERAEQRAERTARAGPRRKYMHGTVSNRAAAVGAAACDQHISDSDLTAVFVRAMADPSPKVRAAVALALEHRPLGACARPLVNLVNDPDDHVAAAALHAVAVQASADVVEPLLVLLDQVSASRVASILPVLGRLVDVRVARKLFEILQSANGPLGDTIFDALIEQIPVTMDLLRLLAGHSEERMRVIASRLLGYSGATEAVPVLSELTHDLSPAVRIRAARSLALIPACTSAEVANILSPLLVDPSPIVCEATHAVLVRLQVLQPSSPPSRSSESLVGVRSYVEGFGELGETLGALPNEDLASRLDDDVAAVRRAAIYILGWRGCTAAATAIARKLADPSPDVVEATIETLELLEHVPAFPALAAIAREATNKPHLRAAAMRALAKIEPTWAVDITIALATDVDPEISEAAVKVLGDIGDEHAVAVLTKLVRNASNNTPIPVLQSAIGALGTIGGEKAVTVLAELLEDRDRRHDWMIGDEQGHRMAAAEALGVTGHPTAVPHLCRVLVDESIRSSMMTHSLIAQLIESLGTIGDVRAVPHIIAAVGTLAWLKPTIRWRAEEAFVRIGKACVVPLSALVADNAAPTTSRIVAAGALGQLADPSAEASLLSALPGITDDLHQKLLIALGSCGREAAASSLLKLLSDAEHTYTDEPLLFRSLAAVLVRTDTVLSDAVPLSIVRAMQDIYAERREAAAKLLGHLGSEQAKALLLAALHDKDWKVRVAAAESLERIGPPDDIASHALYDAARGRFEESVHSGAAEAIEACGLALKAGYTGAALPLARTAGVDALQALSRVFEPEEDSARCENASRSRLAREAAGEAILSLLRHPELRWADRRRILAMHRVVAQSFCETAETAADMDFHVYRGGAGIEM